MNAACAHAPEGSVFLRGLAFRYASLCEKCLSEALVAEHAKRGAAEVARAGLRGQNDPFVALVSQPGTYLFASMNALVSNVHALASRVPTLKKHGTNTVFFLSGEEASAFSYRPKATFEAPLLVEVVREVDEVAKIEQARNEPPEWVASQKCLVVLGYGTSKIDTRKTSSRAAHSVYAHSLLKRHKKQAFTLLYHEDGLGVSPEWASDALKTAITEME